LCVKKGKIRDPVYNFEMDSEYLTDHFYDSRISKFEWIKAKELKLDHGYMGRMSFPEDVSKPSRTVMATMSPSTRESLIFYSFTKDGNYNGYRLPTAREAACFMSFPINYQFEGNESVKYRLIGNAVCPKFSSYFATEILKKEGLLNKTKTYFEALNQPKINLNGTKRKVKFLQRKRYESKFSQHVPYLKIRNYRVGIENIKSDFNRRNIIWNGVLHHGTGQGAQRLEINQTISKKLSSDIPEMKEFYEDLLKLFNHNKFNHKTLHEEFLYNNNLRGPRMILFEIKKIIDKHFPESTFKMVEINHRERGLNIGNGSMPIRIVAAICACSLFISLL
jgi:DNA (cytosine-5)-methyltransferase 1